MSNRCAYVSPETGRRCTETAGLHLHHDPPYARGGTATVADLSLRCPAHNTYQAVLDFGAEHMAAAIRKRQHRPPKRDQRPPRRRV